MNRAEKITVFSPVALSEKQKREIAKKAVALFTLKNIVVNNVIDKNLMAGIKIEYGSLVLDLSLKNQLKRIQNQLRQ